MEVYTTDEKLKQVLRDVLKEIIPLCSFREQPDTLDIDRALEMLGENGYKISKAQIYKLTSAKDIPHRTFGNKLIFSKKELLEWAVSRVKEKQSLTEGYLFGRNRLRKKK